MKKTWENDSCEAVQSYFTVYRVPVAAALWCGIEPGEVEDIWHCPRKSQGAF
jgi:hypothetical protein